MRDLRIGELAKATRTTAATIRYYEEVGLMPLPSRGEGGQRLYSNRDVERLSFLRRCRALGFSLSDLQGFCQVAKGAGQPAGCRPVVERRLTDVRRRIVELESTAQRLETLLQNADSSDQCTAVAALA